MNFSWSAAQDTLSGIALYRLLLNGVAVDSTVSTSIESVPPEGLHTWSVAVEDNAGNGTQSTSREIGIDRTPPGNPPAARAFGPCQGE